MPLVDQWLNMLIRQGPLTVIYADGRRASYGRPVPALAPVTIRLTDRATLWRIMRQPSLGTGEAYMDGRLILEQGDICDLLDLVGYNGRWHPDNPARVAPWHHRRIAALLGTWNWKRRSQRNVAHHYDLPDRLYDLFLDADRQYSCAY